MQRLDNYQIVSTCFMLIVLTRGSFQTATCPVCRTVAEPRMQLGHDNLATEVQPTATMVEDGGVSRHVYHELEKVGTGCSGLRTASFPRMVIITRERSLRRNHSYDGSAVTEDIEKK